MSFSSNVLRLPTVPSLSWDDCRLLVESVVDYAIFMLDLQGYVATWNIGAERIKGYTAEEIIGKHFAAFFTPEDIAAGKPQRELELALEHGRYEDENWRVRKDGTRFWANVVITALRDESGKLRGFGKVTRDLSARRAGEEQLRQSERRFHQMVDAVIDYAIFMLDATGHVATWNSGARRLKGYDADEIIGQHFSVFYTDEDQAAGRPDAILETVRSQGRFEDEGWRKRKDGSRFWASVVLTALHDSHGAVIGFAKITRDLTSRREKEESERRLLTERAAREAAEDAEGRLRQSEARSRALSQRLEIVLEGVADGITVQDRTGRFVFANTAAARLCGFGSGAEFLNTPPGEVLARYEILDLDERPFDVASLPARRALAGLEPGSGVLHFRERQTRHEWWVLLRASAVRAPDGTPELAVSIWHDVTVERRHERQAQYLADATAALGRSLEEHEMLSSLAAQLVPGLGDWCSIYALDGDRLVDMAFAHTDTSNVEAANEYRRRFPPDPLHAGDVWGVVRSGKSQVLNGITDDLLTRSTTDPEALGLLRTVGMRAALIAPMRIREQIFGAIALVSAENDRRYDAADQALLEEVGRRAGVALENARLYQSARYAAKTAEEASRAKDEFLATLSHELRTPLSAVLGWSSILKEQVKDPSLSKPVEAIHRNARAQVKIIDDILDVSRVITGNFRIDPKPADLVAIAREAIDVIRPAAAAKSITVRFMPTSDICLLVGDRDRLLQVVWNLLSNAVNFTNEGGVVRVGVGQHGPTVVLSVADTGRGIEPALLPHVFERFWQADSTTTRRVGGLGLGLALVRHIIELHGGRVVAESEGPGKGATFTVSLPVRAVAPIASNRPESPAPTVSPATPRALEGVHVLVVDDEPDAREVVAEVLQRAGAIVEAARSGADAYEQFLSSRPDVVVSDIGLPDEDGYSLMRRLRALPIAEGAHVPSLALTAFTRGEDRARALAAGYTSHVGKPIDPDGLVSAVANLALLNRSN